MSTPHATVKLRGAPWPVHPGDRLTFGRDADRRIRMAHDPVDDYVSRKAGTLIVEADGILVRNDSYTQHLILQADPGPEMIIGPRTTAGTGPYTRLRLVVPGRHRNRYVLHLDTSGLLTERPAETPAGTGATRPAAKVSPRERRLLAALCEPLLIRLGAAAVPATYREVSLRVGQKPDSVRTCLDALRLRLTTQDGIPGLRGTDGHADGVDYRWALARWAMNSGTVRRDHLALLRPLPYAGGKNGIEP